jgi:hypothetical protein
MTHSILPSPSEHSENAAVPAIWIRPPKGSEPCPHTGTRHGTFYRVFVGNPRIRQCITAEGKRKGTRLLWLPDIHAELNRLADSQARKEAS